MMRKRTTNPRCRAGDEEARVLSDVSEACELEPMVEPNLLSAAMRRWVRSFSTSKRGGKR